MSRKERRPFPGSIRYLVLFSDFYPLLIRRRRRPNAVDPLLRASATPGWLVGSKHTGAQKTRTHDYLPQDKTEITTSPSGHQHVLPWVPQRFERRSALHRLLGTPFDLNSQKLWTPIYLANREAHRYQTQTRSHTSRTARNSVRSAGAQFSAVEHFAYLQLGKRA